MDVPEISETPSLPEPWPRWPSYGTIDDLLPSLTRWALEGKRAALATLVSVQGSSPRPVGSEMVISDRGEVAGYVSGGCVEAAVAREALASLADGRPRTLDFGAGSPVIDIQLSCGGRIGIFVRPIVDLPAYIRQRSEAQRERRVLSVVTDLGSGEMAFVDGAAKMCPGVFVRRHHPRTRLVLVGADPVTLAVLELAQHFDLEMILLRPQGPEAPPEGLEIAVYDRRRLDTALDALVLDRWTAVYSLTHTAHDDLFVARRALMAEAFCVGILGSRGKIASRVQALRQDGVSDEALGRLHLPAGLDIAARGPREIALSILAQIVAMRGVMEA